MKIGFTFVKLQSYKGQIVLCTWEEHNNKANGFNSSKEYVGSIYIVQFFLSVICRSDCTHNVSTKLLLKAFHLCILNCTIVKAILLTELGSLSTKSTGIIGKFRQLMIKQPCMDR